MLRCSVRRLQVLVKIEKNMREELREQRQAQAGKEKGRVVREDSGGGGRQRRGGA